MAEIKKYAGEEAVSRIADYVNKKLTIVSVMPTSPTNGQIVLYAGASDVSGFPLQGGIYEYSSATTSWKLINQAKLTKGAGIELTNDATTGVTTVATEVPLSIASGMICVTYDN